MKLICFGTATLVAGLVVSVPSARAQKASSASGGTTTGRSVVVPFDHAAPRAGHTALYVELGAPFDAAKPTVLVIADGQQFYIRRGAMAELQQTLFGNAFNVAGIVTRGSTAAFIQSAIRSDGTPDWRRAWRIFNSSQWVEDIEAVRRSLVGPNGNVLLFGRSGGAYLVHEFLAKHGAHVRRAFIQSAVNPGLNRELGIPLDTYWDALRDQDPALQPMLRAALASHPAERIPILLSLQRQHFYVPAESLSTAKATLISALARGEMPPYEQARKRYEVDDVLAMSRSTDIVPQNVRVVELIQPSGAFDKLGADGIFPMTESQAFFTGPLLELIKAGDISVKTVDGTASHRLATELFVLAGREDEAVDYRTSIALAASYPRHELFIAADNHVFARLNAAGHLSHLVQAFLGAGIGSAELRAALASAETLRWTGR